MRIAIEFAPGIRVSSGTRHAPCAGAESVRQTGLQDAVTRHGTTTVPSRPRFGPIRSVFGLRMVRPHVGICDTGLSLNQIDGFNFDFLCRYVAYT